MVAADLGDRHPITVVEAWPIPACASGPPVELLADEQVGIRPRAGRAADVGSGCHDLGRAVGIVEVQLPDRRRACAELRARAGEAEAARPPAVGERDAEDVLTHGERRGHVVGLHRDAVLVGVRSRREHLVVGAFTVDEGGVRAARRRVEAGARERRSHVERLPQQLRGTQTVLGRSVGAEAADPVDDAPALDDGILLIGLHPGGDPVRRHPEAPSRRSTRSSRTTHPHPRLRTRQEYAVFDARGAPA